MENNERNNSEKRDKKPYYKRKRFQKHRNKPENNVASEPQIQNAEPKAELAREGDMRKKRHRNRGRRPERTASVEALQSTVLAQEPAPAEFTEPEALTPALDTPPEPKPIVDPVEVIGVRFRNNGKIYYFDPAGQSVQKSECVIVETSRGVELGHTALANRFVSGENIVQPLRRVIRIATEADKERYTANKEKEREAFCICAEKIREHKIDMRLVDAEYTFDNSKLLFYFTAEGRVDFRELVKDLAAIFRTRIELRQIGIRDEAKIFGGLGICGRPLCCKSFLYDFSQVSIKMAKEQNLSLNSSKISGTCGRLMCCLKFEHEIYEEEIAKTPKLDSIVSGPDGEGIVIETLPLTGMVKVKPRDEQKPPKFYHRDTLTVIGHARVRHKAKDQDISEEELKTLEGE